MKDLMLSCESPLERVLLASIACCDIHAEHFVWTPEELPRHYFVGGWGPGGEPGCFGLGVLFAQFQIAGYRADFVLTAFGPAKPRPLVIEVDGHEFHERTKEQARRDRARDRDLLARGFQTVRFTGSEVYADPIRCARQALALAMKVAGIAA